MKLLKEFLEVVEQEKLAYENEELELKELFLPDFLKVSTVYGHDLIEFYSEYHEEMIYSGSDVKEAYSELKEQGLIWTHLYAKGNYLKKVYVIHEVMFLDPRLAESLMDGKEEVEEKYIYIHHGDNFESGVSEEFTLDDPSDFLIDYAIAIEMYGEESDSMHARNILESLIEMNNNDPSFEVDLSCVEVQHINLEGLDLSNVILPHSYLNEEKVEPMPIELLSVAKTHALSVMNLLGYEARDLVIEDVQWEKVAALLRDTVEVYQATIDDELEK